MTGAAHDHLLRTLAAVPFDSRILDADCEDAARLDALNRLGFDVFATHPAPDNVAALRSVAPTAEDRILTARAGALGFPDDYFDWVIADRASAGADLLEYTLDALTELRRVLKPGGWLYLVLPVGPDDAEATDDECLLGFYRLAAEARLELAENGTVDADDRQRFARAIFRRVEAGTAV